MAFGIASVSSASLCAADATVLSSLPGYDYSTSFAPLADLDAAVASAGKDPEKCAALVARLTEMIRQPACTFAARQAICQRLGYLLSGPGGAELSSSHPTLAVLGPWLEDAKLSPLALLALERVPGAAIDQLIREVAQHAQGTTLDALQASLRRRQKIPAPAISSVPALATLVEYLGGADMAKQEQALAQLPSLPAAEVAAAVAEKLSIWDADTQSSALVMLGRLGNAVATPAILTATGHASSSVRLAAIDALGRLPGTPEIAQRLLELAGGKAMDETKAALVALSTLNGAEVTRHLLSCARQGQPAVRVLSLRALASRNALEALPLVYQLRQDKSPVVRAAALDVLNDIAPFSEQAAVLAWALNTTEGQEMARAQRALVTITQRAPNLAAGVGPVLDALEKSAPAVQVRHLRLLARLGDDASLTFVARFAQAASSDVSGAALSTLARWPNTKAFAPLAAVLASSTNEARRNSTAAAAIELLNQKRGFLSVEEAATLPVLFGVVQEAELRRQFLQQLSRASDEASAHFAESFAGDPTLGCDARLAAENIRANLRWPPVFNASSPDGNLRNLCDKSIESRWSLPAKAGAWLQVDFKEERPLRRLVLSYKSRENDFPEQYEVYVGNVAGDLGAALIKGQGARGETLIDFPEGTRARYVRIVNSTERSGGTWTICDFQVE